MVLKEQAGGEESLGTWTGEKFGFSPARFPKRASKQSLLLPLSPSLSLSTLRIACGSCSPRIDVKFQESNRLSAKSAIRTDYDLSFPPYSKTPPDSLR
ncbi:hypothetical protein NL676_016411 [Syzygium grande]|nr:hypothetical protein NL676_016411 [Syzygium grande]